MDRLDFHTNILGKKAADKLRKLDGEFLTLRSKKPIETVIDIYLDHERLGSAKVFNIYEKISLGHLDKSLARLGGFDTIEEQQQALKKAGYRFKPLEEYKAYPIFFTGLWGRK